MKYKYSPQRRDDSISYAFDGDKITCTMVTQSDTFDFTSLPDGKLEEIETTLPESPIIEAWREGGVLHVVLLKNITADATEAERYPGWVVV